MRPFLLLAAFILAGVATTSSRAEASPVTLGVSGNVDLTEFGGSATSTIDLTFTWDGAAAILVTSGATFSQYELLDATVLINGVDYTSQISPVPPLRFRIGNDEPGDGDSFYTSFDFFPSVDVDSGAFPDIGRLALFISAPTTAFANHNPAPADLAWLSGACACSAFVFDTSETFSGSFANASLSAVPEPGTMSLMASAFAAAGLRRWRRRII